MGIKENIKDGAKSILKVNRKTFFDPAAWLDFDSLKRETKAVGGLFKTVFSRDKTPVRQETFEQAMQRLRLTDEAVREIGLNYLSFAVFFVLAALILVVFAFYMLLHQMIAGFALAIAISAVMFAQAFRNHFLYFQIKHRKLGCTFEEWRSGQINNDEASS